MSQIIMSRIAELIVLERFIQLIVDKIPIASGKVYYGEPDEIYVNSNSETSGGIIAEERRYPSIGIIPITTDIHYTNSRPVIQQESYSTTGQVKIWTSNVLIEQDNVIHIETTTKRDHLIYKALFILFFENLRKGFQLTNDILPEFQESVNCVLKRNGLTEDLCDSPFQSIFEFKLFYRTYQESLEYLLLNRFPATGVVSYGGIIVSGTVTSGLNPYSGNIVNEIFVNI